MAPHSSKRDIPRAWEVDWAIPAAEGGTPWEAYGWLLDTANELGASDVTILGSTFDALGGLGSAIGQVEAQHLRVQPHQYRIDGITVHGSTRRGFWHVRGPVLAAWADDELLSEIEGKRPLALAAVATWPDDIATWRSVYGPERIGQIRADQEAEFGTAGLKELDPRVADALKGPVAFVNENHAVLSTSEREMVAGALVGLRRDGIGVDVEALRAHLMGFGWQGRLISQVIKLAERVDRGETPRH